MDTVYYNLTARKVGVSGGPDLLKFVPTAMETPAGEVLDFQRCRQRLEIKAALKHLNQAAEENARPETEVTNASAPRSCCERALGWLEVCASLSVIAVSAAAVAVFFGL